MGWWWRGRQWRRQSWGRWWGGGGESGGGGSGGGRVMVGGGGGRRGVVDNLACWRCLWQGSCWRRSRRRICWRRGRQRACWRRGRRRTCWRRGKWRTCWRRGGRRICRRRGACWRRGRGRAATKSDVRGQLAACEAAARAFRRSARGVTRWLALPVDERGRRVLYVPAVLVEAGVQRRDPEAFVWLGVLVSPLAVCHASGWRDVLEYHDVVVVECCGCAELSEVGFEWG